MIFTALLIWVLLQVSVPSSGIAASDIPTFHSEVLHRWEAYNFDSNPSEIQTDALLVSVAGRLVYERYANGYGPTMKHLSWSVSKGFSGLVFGAAISDGYLHESDQLGSFFPKLSGLKAKITLRHLLQLSSGIDSNEIFEKKAPASDIVTMLFREANRDMASYLLALPQASQPGENFRYSGGDTHLLWAALKIAMSRSEDKGSALYDEYPFRRILAPIGIHDFTLEQDGAGVFIGSSYAYATPRDFLKIGQLFLNRGVWEGRRLIPESFAQFQREISPGSSGDLSSHPRNPVGAHVWLNRELAPRGLSIPRPYPSAPPTMCLFLGHQGQGIYLFPESQTIVVRFGHDLGERFHADYFLNLFFKSLRAPEYMPDPLLYAEGAPAKASPVLASPEVFKHAPLEEESSRDGRSAYSSSYLELPSLAAAYAARQYCSCRFVVGQSESYCRKWVDQGVPLMRIHEDPILKTVTARSFWGQKNAEYRGSRLGCRLQFR